VSDKAPLRVHDGARAVGAGHGDLVRESLTGYFGFRGQPFAEPVDEPREAGIYIREQLELAGADTDIFPAAVVQRVAQLAGVDTRRINFVCTQALLLTGLAGQRTVALETVEQAARLMDGTTGPSGIEALRHALAEEALIDFSAPAVANDRKGNQAGPPAVLPRPEIPRAAQNAATKAAKPADKPARGWMRIVVPLYLVVVLGAAGLFWYEWESGVFDALVADIAGWRDARPGRDEPPPASPGRDAAPVAAALAPHLPSPQAAPPVTAALLQSTSAELPTDPARVASVPEGAQHDTPAAEQPPSAAAAEAAAASTAITLDFEATLLRRGDEQLATGDIAAARLFFERAAAEGSARGATSVGKTWDPGFLRERGVRGTRGDAGTAAQWYRKGAALGDAEADMRLGRLER
jgi:hypothetical protein